MIRIGIDNASFAKEFNRVLGRAKDPTAVLMASGRELNNQLVRHFRAKDRTPNKLSSRREHFWLQVSRTVSQPEQTGYNAVTVNVADPRIAQKVFGGTISAKRAGALTIPIEDRAYGRTAATFERETGLKLFLLKKGGKDTTELEHAVLAVKEAGGGITPEYVLTSSVDQDADPTALPDENQLRAAIIARAQKAAERQNA